MTNRNLSNFQEHLADPFNRLALQHENLNNIIESMNSSRKVVRGTVVYADGQTPDAGGNLVTAIRIRAKGLHNSFIPNIPDLIKNDKVSNRIINTCMECHPVVYPNNSLDYCENFLSMMFAMPTSEYKIDQTVVSALNKLLILHADHEQNCSTSTVRLVGSSHANLYASISAGISALWGPLHGGANQAVIEMLEAIKADGGDTAKYLAKAKDKDDPFRLMGFGHRV